MPDKPKKLKGQKGRNKKTEENIKRKDATKIYGKNVCKENKERKKERKKERRKEVRKEHKK